MFCHVFRFELRYWLRGFMVWVFFLIIGAIVLGASSSSKISIGAGLAAESVFKNSAYSVQIYYAILGIFTMLMTTAFVNSSAARDFQHGFSGLLFSTSLTKSAFLFGRFFASSLVAIIPLLGISAGVLLAPLMPWADPVRFGPVIWAAHAKGILYFALPNTVFVATVVFCIAALTRSTITSFLGTLVLLVGYIVSDTLAGDLDNEKLAILLDPLGIRAYSIVSKYWTAAERNSATIALEGWFLWNRLLWLSVGAALFAFTSWRFSFTERAAKITARPEQAAAPATPLSAALPNIDIALPSAARWTRFWSLFRFESRAILRSTSFVVLLAAALLNTIPNIIFSASASYGNTSHPVTYWIVEIVQGSMYLFTISMITFYAGALVWRERDARMDEVEDAAPGIAWLRYSAKLSALLSVMAILQSLAMLTGIAVQTYQGYFRYQPGLYLSELFIYDFSSFVFLAVLAFCVHVLSPNKYLGYFAFVVFLAINAFVWDAVGVSTRMVSYGSRPGYTYSDFYGYAPYLASWWWFTAYWSAFALLLALFTISIWPRGKQPDLLPRLRSIAPSHRRTLALTGALFSLLTGHLYYQSAVVNKNLTSDASDDRAADYERIYKKYASLPQPRVLSTRYDIDLFPEQRRLVAKAESLLANKHAQTIGELHLLLNDDLDYDIRIDGATLASDDTRHRYRIYKLNPPLQPGETRALHFTATFAPKGISQTVRFIQMNQNGTFFNSDIAPQIGYQPGGELSSRQARRKRGLPEKDLMPPLERDCTAKCADSYLNNNADWVMVESVISTSPDQIAVAPGALLREWQQNGRRFFHYKLDRPSANFYSFLSARYTVARQVHNGINTEVYYHAEHPWNVPKMLNSIQQSLDYFIRNFGPYHHRQARIIEFPRVSSFAQAFPGTMPYSESIGFIAKLERPDDVDMVTYIVAHEMAHQWWAHQVLGANMQGATLLSETLAQYSALMVMEKLYGRDMMRKFLEYETDQYLRARGLEDIKERTLLLVEASQGYIHYRKGSAALYYLREMIGEEAINRALRKLIAAHAYKEPPYPTSYALLDALREETPTDLQYLLADLFEHITVFSNRTYSASARKLADGRFQVSVEVEVSKLRSDEKGVEVAIPANDYIEIGAFAAPAKGQRYGKLLHRERLRLRSGKSTHTFVVAELPERAGIDPIHLLIDRIPDDNLKTVAVVD